MSSPIYQEWAACQPPRSTPAPRPPHPLLSVLATALLLAVTVRGWHEVEPFLAYRPMAALVVAGEGAETHFSYEVDGQTYVGSQLPPASAPSDQGSSSRLAPPYSPGTTVAAWFNPWHPSEAVLSRSPDSRLLSWMLALAVIAGLMLLVARPPRVESASDGEPEAERGERSA